MCVEESIHIIFNESDKYNPSIQVDDYEIGLVQPNEKNADSDEEDEIKEERNEENENIHNNDVPVPQGEEVVPIPQVEGTESTIANRGTTDHSSSSTQGTHEEQPVPIREFQPKPWRQQKSHPVELIISDISKGGGQFSGFGGHRDGQVYEGKQQSSLTGQGQKDGFFIQLLTRGDGFSILSKGMLSPLKSQPQNQEREPELKRCIVRWPEDAVTQQVTQQEPEIHYQLPYPSPTSIHLRKMDYHTKPVSEHKLPQRYCLVQHGSSKGRKEIEKESCNVELDTVSSSSSRL
ncbi:hypothetical protein BVRB_2g038260 [Beta vulgaris subsp. vulgaris]|nr:hypothetical protein BVRB_2g038260 [Beta vulgaris subsp. vulgaris]